MVSTRASHAHVVPTRTRYALPCCPPASRRPAARPAVPCTDHNDQPPPLRQSLAYAAGGRAIKPGDDAAIDAVLASVPAFLAAKVKQLSSPSAGLVISHNGEVLTSGWAGSAWANGSAAAPGLDMDSGFMIASLSKTFASVTLFQLRDAGKLPQVSPAPGPRCSLE